MTKKLKLYWKWFHYICLTKNNDIFAGVALTLIFVMIFSIIWSITVGVILAPLFVALFAIGCQANDCKIPICRLIKNFRQIEKEHLIAMMLGCFWVLVCIGIP